MARIGEISSGIGCGTGGKIALLMSGGIGDFLHYLIRIAGYLQTRSVSAGELVVFVEATAPQNVRELFVNSLPGYDVRFVPRSLHWTLTHPLLNASDEEDVRQRPARRYVVHQGFHEIVDWFLPVWCADLPYDGGALEWLRDDSADTGPGTVLVALRDKGHLWWPSSEVFAGIRRLVPNEIPLKFVGNDHEIEDWREQPPLPGQLVRFPSATAALREVLRASLLISTDTGFATARELLRMPNIYCIDTHWFTVMTNYRYWTDAMESNTRSAFAFEESGLREALLRYFADRTE